MKPNKILCSRALASVAMILVLMNIAGATPFAYIANVADNTVSVIDTATDDVTATVPVGIYPYGVAVNPDGKRVYVANGGSNTTSVIDTATNNVTATVPVGIYPYGVAVNPDGTKVYVANSGDNTASVIDTATNNVTATVLLKEGAGQVAVTPDGTKVYVTNSMGVSVIDTATNNVTATVPIENGAGGVAVNPDGTKVYVTNSMGVSVIDTATNNVTATVPLEYGAGGVAVNPDGTKVYVTNGDGVSVIDTEANSVTAHVFAGMFGLHGIAVTPDGRKVYGTDFKDNIFHNTVDVIDTATNTVTARVTVGNGPVGIGRFIGPLIVQPVPPVANFITNVTGGFAPLTVRFRDLSTNATGWNWNFGDGTNSTLQYPMHIYSTAGNYTVNLTVSNANGTDSKHATITVLTQPTNAENYTFVTKWRSVNSPEAIAVDSLRNAYVSQYDIIQKFDSNGTFLATLDSSGYHPGIAVDSSDNIYFTGDNGIQKFDSNGKFLATFNNGGNGIAVDSSGNVYVADIVDCCIKKLDSNGKFLAKWGSQGSDYGQFDHPFGVAADSSGNVYVADVNNNRIQKFDSNGKFLATWGFYGSGDGQLNHPYGVAVDSSGNVYVADRGNNRIQKFDSYGDYITQWGSEGSGDGQFSYPWGVAVDSSGNVYVADTNNNRIQKFALINTALTIVKSASPKNYSTVGQNITYTYNVNNTGNVDILGPINITDNRTGIIPISTNILVPGQNVSGTANYTITQADLDSGSVTNAAFATGTFGNSVTISNTDTKTVTAVQRIALLISKSELTGPYSTVGQNLTYSYYVHNAGNVDILGPINITDNKIGIIMISNGGLAPGQSIIGTANYTITQADLDNGSVINSAFATCTFGNNVITSNYVTAKVIAVQNPALLTVKIAAPTSYNAVGQNITYTYNVINTGNVGIAGPINITDNRTGIILISINRLAPGQKVSGTANYTVIQADLDNGSVTNAAFASGTFNGTIVNSPTVTATVTAVQSPALLTVKVAAPTSYNAVGQNITYTYNVNNTGNVDIAGPINITDNKIGLVTISNSGLVPGQNVSGTANYTVSQADLDNGSVTNAAFATGTFNGTRINSTTVTTTVTAIVQNPALTITKTAYPKTYNKVRQRITYIYTVTNTGNVPVSSIAVTDNKTMVAFSSGMLINGNLAPGSSLGGIGMYTIKQADITAGSVTNSAFATGTFNGKKVTSNQVTVLVKES